MQINSAPENIRLLAVGLSPLDLGRPKFKKEAEDDDQSNQWPAGHLAEIHTLTFDKNSQSLRSLR